MSNINHQIQRIAERYKTYENDNELKEDIQTLLAQLKEKEDFLNTSSSSIGELALQQFIMLTDQKLMNQSMVKTGFEDYDEVFGGLLKGEILVIGGRPGMGKTQFIVNMAVNIASQNIPCGFISLESSAFLLTNRFISNISKVPHLNLMRGIESDNQKAAIKNAVDILNTLPVFISDQFITSLFSVIERCRQLVNENKVEVIMIDYLQMMGNYSRRYNRETELAVIMRELKKVAKELNVAIVLTSQLSRQVENRPGGSKRPQLSDLRESGAIEQDADRVLFIYRPEYYGLEVDEYNISTRYLTELIMAKNSIGPCESVKLKVEPLFTGFRKYSGPYPELKISDERLNDFMDPPF